MSAKPPQAPELTPNQKYRLAVQSCIDLIAALNAGMIERDEEIKLALTALVARQNLLLLGPPGVAKSMVAAAIGQAVPGGYFETLLGRFTEPSQVFGPISIRALKVEDRLHYNTEGFLPSVQVGFLDECFKASDAILNSLLTIMNERKFHNGNRVMHTPLDTIFGASNEMPESSKLEALFDRFLIRHEVLPVKDEVALFNLADLGKVPKLVHLDELQARARAAIVPTGIVDKVIEIRKAAGRAKIVVSNRRLRQSKILIQASAALAGRDTVIPRDLGILSFVFWTTPDQRPLISGIVERTIKAMEQGTTATTAPPPRNPPPGGVRTPAQLFAAVQSLIMSSSAASNGTNAQLHQDIEHLLRIRSGLTAEQVTDVQLWKSSITLSHPWLAR